MTRTLCFIIAMALSASNALAVLQAYFENVEINSELALAQSHTTQDLYINTTAGDTWGTAQILATLTSGSIYQDPNGSFFAPNPLLFDTFPELEYDSYLDGNGQQPMIAGQAVNLGGDVQEFSENHIDITWLSAGQNNIGTFTIGRFTLSDDAYGTWTMMVTSTSGYRTYQGSIVAGEFDLRETGGGEPIVGDLDSDGFVGLADLDIVLGDWNKTIFTGDPVDIGDITSDGFVGLDDLDIILANWNQYVFPGDSSVGDITGDGFVGLDDLDIVLANWNYQIPIVDSRADPTGDMFVGLDDLDLVLGNWNQGTPPTLESLVPEPASASVAVCMIMLGITRRRR